MNINLKQPEIETALRQYIGRKLDLRNSSLEIVFNMGRGNNGLAANLTIEDINIPGFTETNDTEDAIASLMQPSAYLAAVAVEVAPVNSVLAEAVMAVVEELIVEDPPELAVDLEPTANGVQPEPEVIGNGLFAEAAEALLVPEDVPAKVAPAVVTLATEGAEAKTTTSLFG